MNKLATIVLSVVPGVALAQTPPAQKAPAAPPAAGAVKAPAPTPPTGAKAPMPPPGPMKPPTPPAPPAPPPEIKLTVDAFKGNWRFDTTMTATGIPGMEKPFAAKMTFNCKEVAGKTAVSCESKQKTPMGPFEGLFVVSFDPFSKAVHFMSVTSMNEVHDHVCKWSGYDLNCTPLKGGSGPGGDELTEDLKMKFEPAATCKPKEGADPIVSCPPKMVTFTSVSKMTKGGATLTFEGKGKK